MLFLLILIGYTICCTSNVTNQMPKGNTGRSDSTAKEVQAARHSKKLIIGDTIGLVVLNKKFGKHDFVRIYNQDGSIWHRLAFYYDDSDGKYEYAREDFKPFAFQPDHFLLVLRCVGENEGHYEVITDEETELKKYIKADDPVIKFETWEEHILNLFAVNFNRGENPLRQAPEGQIKSVTLPPTAILQPVEVRGDWLKIQWNSKAQTTSKESKYESGWIRWKKEGKLLIEFSYIS